jgi:hypothetical protein
MTTLLTALWGIILTIVEFTAIIITCLLVVAISACIFGVIYMTFNKLSTALKHN